MNEDNYTGWYEENDVLIEVQTDDDGVDWYDAGGGCWTDAHPNTWEDPD